MTEHEEIVRQMAVAIRKQKFARTGRIGCFDETNITDDELSEARAALAVAEPVIREQCVKMVEKSFGIMAGEATNVKHLEWPRHPYKMMPRHIWNWYWTRTLPMHWRLMRAAAAAIREGEKDE